MSKKKRSKILATLLCATTMAAFYASPQLVYAVNLNQTQDGTVTTDSGNNNQAITNIEGLESITFGVQGDMGTGGVRFYFDGTGTYGGLVADGSFTATDLYITVENNADGDGYNSNRYSLRNALGIHRIGAGDDAVTNIEANSQGHGGMQVSSQTVSVLDGTAIFNNTTTAGDRGTISFDGSFDSAQGMTVGSVFTLDETGHISRVTGIDVQGNVTTTGTINSMTIANNQVNGVTLQNNNVTANTVTGTVITDGTYTLSEVGRDVGDLASDVEEIDEKTQGIAEYDSMNGTTFNGNVRASGGLVTGNGTISDNNSHSFTVEDAEDVIDSVNNSTTGLAATYEIATDNQAAITELDGRVDTAEADITSLDEKVDTFDSRITQNTTDIGTLNTKTTGMSYDETNGTTFAHNVNANDFIIDGNTSLSTVASGLTTAEGNITANKNAISGLDTRVTTAEGEIDALQSTTADHESRITTNTNNITSLNSTVQGHTTQISSLETTVEGHTTNINSLTGRVTTAEGDIDTLQTTVEGHTSSINNLNTTVSGHTTQISTLQTDLNAAESSIAANTSNISSLDTRVGAAETDISALEIKTHGFSDDGETLELSTITATTGGTIGEATFSGNSVTGLTNIAGDTVTIAGTPISKGSFNGVNIGVDNNSHATINGVSIYQDTEGHYNVGTIDLNELTSGSGVTIEGIERTENGAGGYITTIEGNLQVNTNGEISNHDGSFSVDAAGNVSATDFKVGDNSFNAVVNDVNTVESTVGDENSGLVKNVNDLTGTVDGHTTSIGTLQTIVGDENSGLVKDVDDLETTVGEHTSSINSLNTAVEGHTTQIGALDTRVDTAETDITALNTKTHGFDETGETLELTTITAESGTIGGAVFSDNSVTGLTTIGTASDTITVAGTPISEGSFNGVNIGVENGHATFNGVSIYQDAANNNDVMVGGINISDFTNGVSTTIEGIERTDNTPENLTDNDFTTTIEENLNVNSNGGISNHDGSFDVAADGNVTATDFRVGDTTFTGMAADVSALNTATTGMTYTSAAESTEAVTSFNHRVNATNVTTTEGADLNALSDTVGDENSGLVSDVADLDTKTQGFDATGETLALTSITATNATVGGVTFNSGTATGLTNIAGDTITVAGAAITSNSFNNVAIYHNDDGYYLGDVNVSALESGSTEITNKLRGITYSNDDSDEYTMTFAGVMSVSTSGEYTFNYNGQSYGLDDLINTVDVGDLEGIEALADRVDVLEDKTTGIEFDEATGETTISHMNGTDTDGDGVNDTFTKGDNYLAVNETGITANGDTVINGDAAGSGSSEPGSGAGDGNAANTVNGDQLVNGNQHVTGDAQFDGTVTVGTEDGNKTAINGGTITTGATTINGSGMTVNNTDGSVGTSITNDTVASTNGVFDNITVGDNTTINNDGITTNKVTTGDTTISNEGVSVKDDLGGVVVGNHDVVIQDEDGNVEASLSGVAQRVDGIEESLGDLNNRMGELEDRIDKVGAMAAAIANLRTMGYDPAAPTEVAVGIGQYRDETGAALGLFHYPNRDFMLSLSVSTSGDEVMGGIGATWKFGRKNPEKVAAEKAEKARKAKLQKAEAIKEAARLKKIEAQQQRHAELAAEEAEATK